ncbi:MAG: hypothetical protein IH974_02445 [Myxococcales bacterium]|nr:hypothetical protein [Myxococcales bacterium]
MSRSRSQISLLMTTALGLGSALWIATGCGEIEVMKRWPSGATLLANTRSLDRLLERVARLEGTPLARRAEAIRALLPNCPTVEGRAESGRMSDLWTALDCATGRSDLVALEQARNGWDLAVSVPVAGDHWLGTLSIRPSGDVEIEIRLPRVAAEGLASLALPGEEATGAVELSESETLLHARVRPRGGLDLASLIPSDSQGARLFRLKSKLFAGVALDGVWEIAIYLPEVGDPMPPTALALNFSHRSAAVAAMEDFIGNLQESWPVARTFFQIDEAEGACLLDLAIMPGLAPCYVATERALILGWNPASLRKALDGHRDERDGLGDFSAAIIHLDRFADADRILSSALSAEAIPHSTRYPWRRITAKGAPDPSGFRLQLRFESGLGT